MIMLLNIFVLMNVCRKEAYIWPTSNNTRIARQQEPYQTQNDETAICETLLEETFTWMVHNLHYEAQF